MVGKSTAPIDRKQNDAGESTLGNLVADAQRQTMQTQISLMNPGGIRNDLDAGDITWGELYGIQPFGNQLIKVDLTGQDIRDILNQQWQKEQQECFKFQVFNIRGMQINQTVKSYKYTFNKRKELSPSTTYSVVANAFLASGGDGFVSFKMVKCRNWAKRL